MFVIHDGQEFINRQHLGKRFSIEQFLGSLLGDGVGESPVRVVCHNQIPNAIDCLFLCWIYLLPAKVSAVADKAGVRKD